ncbi:cytidyltransferase [Clostridiaceae bacterium 35-E11]
MENLLVNRLYNQILNELLGAQFLNEFSICKQLIKKHIKNNIFRAQISRMVESNDFTAFAIFNLCRPMMNELAPEDPTEGWLHYIYQFTLSKSFPKAVEIELSDSLNKAAIVYLKVLRVMLRFKKASDKSQRKSMYMLDFLTQQEEEELENPDEYHRLKKAFEEEYIYEMMQLNKEVIGYSTLHHVCGVHNLALFIARQLKKSGFPVDLGRVSGAAAGHDIGKFGCKKSEQHRVSYLHYYYTDQWFKRHQIPYIGNIAVNHSTWDLELENLSLESLILIYCDFRVKEKREANQSAQMHIYSLKESFHVILNKLDNVDQVKEKRYHRVYAKLKDFEDYMIELGIYVNMDEQDAYGFQNLNEKKYYSLMQGKEIVENLKYLSIHHNIHLMHQLRDEFSLNTILEGARSEGERSNLREYIYVFEEYSTYMTQKQKMIMINFLYDQLIHREDDIRRQVAELIGILMATFDEDYRKEVPENVELSVFEITSHELFDKYLNMLFYPDPKVIPVHRGYMGESISIIIKSLFTHCRRTQIKEYLTVLQKHYRNSSQREMQLYLLETAKHLPLKYCDAVSIHVFMTFLEEMLCEKDYDLRIHGLETSHHLVKEYIAEQHIIKRFREIFRQKICTSDFSVENYLKLKTIQLLGLDTKMMKKCRYDYLEDMKSVSHIFLSNLKTSTSPVVKKIQIDFLLEYTMDHLDKNGLYTAIHFCNMLKVSAKEDVRNHGGEALLAIVPHISFEQRNDVVIELVRGLGIEGYQFAKYIPEYLGKLILYLSPVELDEFIEDITKQTKQSNTQMNGLLLKTIGITIENYHRYKELFEEDEKVHHVRLVKMLGILLNGLVHYNQQVKNTAFSVIGKDIFGSQVLDLNKKNQIFQLIAKKLLTLIADDKEKNLLAFFNHAAGLNHIYRFIADYTFYQGDTHMQLSPKIAFFPGTFDPFSLSHKEIAREIRRLGFEVYLAVDEFSWSKKTQPNLIRRNIIKMSIADELGMYLYPEDLSTNIANDRDLKRLRQAFPYSEVYIVAGSDVILNASAYTKKPGKDSIHTFPHVIFDRRSIFSSKDEDARLDAAIKNIGNKCVRLMLAPQYEDISSTQIRNCIDQNRDIAKLIDPLAQQYIYEKSLYRREPQYKTLVQTKSISVEVVKGLTPEVMQELSSLPFFNFEEVYEKLQQFAGKLNPRIVLLRSIEKNGEIFGFSAFHWVRSSMIFKEFQDEIISEYVRNHSVGRILVIDGIFVNDETAFENIEQMVLTETLAYALPKDYTYAVFKNMLDDYPTDDVEEVLKAQGFEKLPYGKNASPTFVVNMTAPCTLSLEIEALLKEPFRSNENLWKAIKRSRKRLQEALTRLYPGHLVLSFDRNMTYENLIKKICDENDVPTVPLAPRKLGAAMCAPFGNILTGTTVPNTVTKSLHTEKLFEPDMKDFNIAAYPYYLDLENQVRMIRSFDRPVILVDDLLNKGYRIKVVDPLFKKEEIVVKKIIVGILSGRGKELMEMQNREVDCAYFIPKLRAWFNESLMYPFIGGDTLWRGAYPQHNLVPSVNLILPYTNPTFIRDASKKSIYHLSEVCLENAMDIMTTLEEEYQKIHARGLTLRHLGEVFIAPRYPDRGKDMHYDLTLNPSHYLKNDLEHLKRLKMIMVDR